MSDLNLLWTIQLAPLAVFLAVFALPKTARRAAPALGVLGAGLAAVSCLVLAARHGASHGLRVEFQADWLRVSGAGLWPGVSLTDYRVVVGFLLDPVNLLMLTLVTVISFFVQVFSVYYMAEDPSRPRYFAFLSFFSFTMTGLVLSNNLLQTFLFWELVGLASYLLIGFWVEKPAAATAARKAFVVNRLADLGFYLGIVLLFIFTGTLRFADLQPGTLGATLSPGILTFLGLLVLCGVMGKSAQFPFHVWLPDAMEGPTPVSALIHSATMVAAGVFLLVRSYGLFAASAATLDWTLAIGALTALVGAALATSQRDIKKILAYSTVSQLGFMVMAIGAGAPASGMFHLTTHAFFKSMLFLTAGAFIHRFHTNDIWEIGRSGGASDRLALGALAFGLLSLAGLPPLAGFFSKDLILEALRERGALPFAAGLLVSFLTVYYSTRLFLVIALTQKAPQAHGHAAHEHHETPVLAACRALPLVSLGGLSLVAGAAGTPVLGHRLLHWLGAHTPHTDWTLVGITLGLIAGGAGLGWAFFRDPAAAEGRLLRPAGAVRRALDRKFYIDDLYVFWVKRVGLGIAAFLNLFDKKVPNRLMVDRTSYAVLDLGKIASRLQSGLLQDYLSVAVAATVLILFFLMRSRGL